MPEGTDLATASSDTGITLFGTSDPNVLIDRASKVANALGGVIKRQRLFKNIAGRDHVLIEGWTLLGSMLGVFPICVWTRRCEGGWEARVEARTRDGSIVGAAEAQCLANERNWNGRDDYALRSMAQTRAASKALRLPLGFVVQLAGFETTPAEEMVDTTESGGEKMPRRTRPAAKKPDQPAGAAPAAAPNGGARPAGEVKQWNGIVAGVFVKSGTKRAKDGSQEKWNLYTVKGSDGTAFTTFSDTVATDAKHAKEEELPVKIDYHEETYTKKDGSQGVGFRVDKLVVAGDEENAATEPPAEDDAVEGAF